MAQVYDNNLSTSLNATVTTLDTTFSIVAGDGDQFPQVTGGDYFLMTLIGLTGVNETSWEVVKVTGVTANSFTVVRAQEGTTAQAWASGTRMELRLTAGTAERFEQAYGWGNHGTQSYATTSYVDTAVSNLVDAAPATLDTLNELAAALGDDPNFATTVSTSLGLKANSADLATVATTGAYSDLSGTPTAVSAFSNDANYLDSVAFTDIGAGAYLTSAETFANVDDQLMTAAAIDAHIEGKGYQTTNTTYSEATSSVHGLVKVGFAESGKNYPVELNASGQMFVNVPWTDTDTNTTYTASSGVTLVGTDIRHADTSTQSSVDNSGNTFIQDITLDGNGHITNINSAGVSVGVTSVTGSNGISGTVTSTGSLTLDSDLRAHAWQIGRDTSDYYIVNTTTHDWYLDGVLDMRLSNTGQLDVDGDVVAYSTVTSSDAKLKKDVEPITDALTKVLALEGVLFTWNDLTRKEGERDIGVIAQNVQQVVPELVREVETLNSEGQTHLTVDYPKMAALFIEAFRELNAKIEGNV